jgi:winged helix-turn helix protein
MTIRGPRPERILLTPQDAAQLQVWAHEAPHSMAMRARIIWSAAGGDSNTAIAQRYGVARSTVVRWRARFAAFGLVGLVDEPRPGRPRTIDVAPIEALFRAQDAADGKGKPLSTRSVAAYLGISQSTVSRAQRAVGADVCAWRDRADPLLGYPVREVVGLFVCPPGRAFVVSADIAPASIEPYGPRPESSLPSPPRAPRITSGDGPPRHCPAGLYATLRQVACDAAALSVLERAPHLVAFLRTVEARVSEDLQIHVVTDDRSASETVDVRDWTAAHPRLVIHCTPTGTAWLLLAQLWFGESSRRTDARTVRALNADVRAWMRAYAREPCPYSWIRHR